MREEQRIVRGTQSRGGPLRPAASGGPPQAALTPKEIIGMLRRHVWLIIGLTIFGACCGSAGWFLLKRYAPKYRAMTFIRVLPPIVKDPTVVQAPMVAKDIQYGYRLSMAALLKSQNVLQELLTRDEVKQTEWFQSFGDIQADRIRKAVRNLKKRLGASPQRDGDSIIVSMTCRSKEESALIVNEMVQLFLSMQGGKKREEVTAKLTRLETQRLRIQSDLRDAEAALDDVRRRYGFSDLEEHAFQPIIERKLADLEMQQNELVMDIGQTQATIERLEEQATGPVQVQVERQVERDPVMTMLAQQLALRESALASSLSKFGENHRVVRQIREFINAIEEERAIRKATIAEQTRQSNLRNAQDMLITMERKLEELERMREEAAAKKRDLDLARAQYQQRVAIRDERRVMLDSIKQQAEKLKIIHDDPETPKVQFVARAPEPLEMSFPRWRVFLPGGTMLGLMLGVGIAFLIEVLNDLVRTPRDIARYLHIPLLCMIPDAAEDDEVEDVDLALVVRQAPYSIISESYRRFRTNLRLSASAESTKALLVTSGVAADGKTSVAVNFATTLVADNKKVLIIDANFRRPNLHNIFPGRQAQNRTGEQMGLGLSNSLLGQCDYAAVVRPSGIQGLDIIESGPMPANPAELLGGARMEQLIKQQRQNYDYVIVDGPPVLLASETKVLAKCVDGTILVFNAAATRRGAALRTIRELRSVNTEIIGCVLLGVKTLKGGYFREQFRSYREYQKLQLARPI